MEMHIKNNACLRQYTSADSRDASLDIMKGILTLLMIGAHVVQFFPLGSGATVFSAYVNLTTFSGFMFAFGYVINLAYIRKPLAKGEFKKRIRRNFARAMGAYYISGIAYTILVDRGGVFSM